MKTLMGNSEFKRRLTALYAAAKVTGPMLQELIEDGLQQAAHPANGGHGSLNRLTMVIHACQQVKTLPTRTIQRYIQQHTDVKWCKLPDGTMGFKFNGSAGSQQPTVAWFDWEGNTENKAKVDVDIVKNLKSMLTRAKNAQEKGGKVEHEELIPAIEKLLRDATAQVHTA